MMDRTELVERLSFLARIDDDAARSYEKALGNIGMDGLGTHCASFGQELHRRQAEKGGTGQRTGQDSGARGARLGCRSGDLEADRRPLEERRSRTGRNEYPDSDRSLLEQAQGKSGCERNRQVIVDET
jgi:hypothetical protein